MAAAAGERRSPRGRLPPRSPRSAPLASPDRPHPGPAAQQAGCAPPGAGPAGGLEDRDWGRRAVGSLPASGASAGQAQACPRPRRPAWGTAAGRAGPGWAARGWGRGVLGGAGSRARRGNNTPAPRPADFLGPLCSGWTPRAPVGFRGAGNRDPARAPDPARCGHGLVSLFPRPGGRAAGETAGCGAERSDLTLTFGPKADCEFPRFQSGDGAGQ